MLAGEPTAETTLAPATFAGMDREMMPFAFAARAHSADRVQGVRPALRGARGAGQRPSHLQLPDAEGDGIQQRHLRIEPRPAAENH